MRRILAALILLTVAAFWVACGNQSSAPNDMKGGNSAPAAHTDSAPVTSAPSGGAPASASNTSAAPRNANAAPGIKPPTDK